MEKSLNKKSAINKTVAKKVSKKESSTESQKYDFFVRLVQKGCK